MSTENEDETAIKAVAFNKIAAILGGSLEWESEHLDDIANVVDGVVKKLGLPRVGDQNKAALTYWANVANKYGFGYDDPRDIEWDENGDQA